ncbi:C45 family autoproteolytic acyltransferase/hydolase [Pelagibius sp. Alg239-R121]|uniref:C45 family autoproteolytic acyltransferase/hydolase n=1 Tax=Pelagibius sp. Alg239-R121 TaxID=2993448 RepID=UPI0024A76908|nr:C45 family autoproteolytic acyltransferase/hydolase [Pelagibius sp. Alg239-R121]
MAALWNVDVLSCRGSSYDVGRQVAEGFRKTPRGRAFKRRKERRPFAFSLKNAEAALTMYAPNIWEELHGLADGLEISLERAVAEFSNGRLRYPKRGCSAVMTGGLYGRNYDFSPKRYDRLLVAIQPDGVNASIGFSDRFTGRDDGMNEHGLCVGLHYVNEANWQPGLVCILIVRILLDQCANTAEAVDLAKRLPHGLGFNYSMIDALGNAAVVEASPAGIAVRQGAALACTNHFQSADLQDQNRRNAGSFRRLPTLEAWSQELIAAEDLFFRLNASRSPVFAHGYTRGGGTLHSFVCEASRRKMLVGVGGDATPMQLDFGAWVTGSDLTVAQLTGQLGGRLKPFDPSRRARKNPASGGAESEKTFVDADLSGASFKDVSLKDALFENANMAGAKFTDINLAGARLDNINLSDVEITRNCNFKGMTIAGVRVQDLFEAYRNRGSAKDS